MHHRVHENIIIMEDLSVTHQRSIGDPPETNRRPIEDILEIDNLIGDLDMLHQRLTCPIGDRHAPSETNLPHLS